MLLINLTPHAIHLPDIDLVVEPSGKVARCSEVTSELFRAIVGEKRVPCVMKTYGEVLDLPDPQKGVMYIVSMMVRVACPNRDDLASPGDAIRDSDGKIVGAKNLVVNG